MPASIVYRTCFFLNVYFIPCWLFSYSKGILVLVTGQKYLLFETVLFWAAALLVFCAAVITIDRSFMTFTSVEFKHFFF